MFKLIDYKIVNGELNLNVKLIKSKEMFLTENAGDFFYNNYEKIKNEIKKLIKKNKINFTNGKISLVMNGTILMTAVASSGLIMELNNKSHPRGNSNYSQNHSVTTDEDFDLIFSDIDDKGNLSDDVILPNEIVDETKSAPAVVPKYRVLLIAGHGASDVGAVYNGRQEATYNQNFVNELSAQLKEKSKNIDILLENKSMKADEEANYISALKPDFVLNIHFNAGKGTGSEIIVPFNDSNLNFANGFMNKLKNNNFKVRSTPMFSKSSSRKLARKVNDTPTSEKDYFAVIRSGAKINIPSYILEVEFIDNEEQMKIYDQRSKEYITLLANHLNDYFSN